MGSAVASDLGAVRGGLSRFVRFPSCTPKKKKKKKKDEIAHQLHLCWDDTTLIPAQVPARDAILSKHVVLDYFRNQNLVIMMSASDSLFMW